MSRALVIMGANFYTNRVDTVSFTESVPCTSIALSQQSVAFDAIGDTATITATLTPTNTTDELIWASSDETIATVSGGVITCTGVGEATITAVCGSESATCSVGYSGELYIQTTGSSYIVTDIHESQTVYNYEAVVSNDLNISEYTSSHSGNGHIFSSKNMFYPFLKTNDNSYVMISHPAGIDNTINVSNYTSGTFIKLTGQLNGNTYNASITSEEGQTAIAELSTQIGTTYDPTNTFVICGYGGSITAARFRLVGKVKHIKLFDGDTLAYNFVAAKKITGENTLAIGLFETVHGLFYVSDGEPFTSA